MEKRARCEKGPARWTRIMGEKLLYTEDRVEREVPSCRTPELQVVNIDA